MGTEKAKYKHDVMCECVCVCVRFFFYRAPKAASQQAVKSLHSQLDCAVDKRVVELMRTFL